MMPNKDLIKSRKQFVGQKRKAARSNESVAAAKMALGQPSKKGPSDAALRKKFFVKTRAQELKAAGKKVDRKKLAARYESGKVKRSEFYAGGLKEKTKRTEAAKPKPTVARKNYGSARSFEGTSSKSSSGSSVLSGAAAAAAAKMALGQPYSRSGTSTAKTTTKPAPKSTTTTTAPKKSSPKPTVAPKSKPSPKPTVAPKPTVPPKPKAGPKPTVPPKPKKK
jgi:hypothetical protein